jgi:SAM-dependent methyltransferase
MTSTRSYFEKHAGAFDRLYARPNVATSLLRRGPLRRRDLAVSVVGRHPSPTVLDVGCGPGRVAEAVMGAGAAKYVGIDVSRQMLALAGQRLHGFESVELLEGDFLEIDIARTFDVVLALGLFDYLDQPGRSAEWMHAHCSSTLVASFPRWDWIKGPIRHVRYELLHRCPIFNYTEADLRRLLGAAGFSSVEFVFRGRHGFLVCATS